MPETPTFEERAWASKPIRSLGLKIAGTRLEPILAEFAQDLERVGLLKIKPVFYLSTEWGVPVGTVAIAIPFYLAHPSLMDFHAEKVGHIEGITRRDILRYLRHEMGHVVNYAHLLYQRDDWTKLFGAMTQPYVEDYRPKPFSRRFVRHLPGWYAQKHPDEDWAETFAVWMTPGQDWRADYAGWARALEKLEYCQRVIAELREQEPAVSAADLDEDVTELAQSVEQFYAGQPQEDGEFPSGLDGSLRSIFEDLGQPEHAGESKRVAASELIRGLQKTLLAEVYRWTGHFPERTGRLVQHLARRADDLRQVFPKEREAEVRLALTTFITALAMNHVHTGSYLP